MKIDCLVAEIGSTTTLINAFQFNPSPVFLGSGLANTTVDSDVRVGLQNAKQDLMNKLGVIKVSSDEMFASSSAAGGLRMTVSGLVYEMTVKASKQAALNAGANIHHISSGMLEEIDLESIKEAKPNIILVSGGTDFGERETAYKNLVSILNLKLNIPIIYAGNIANHPRIKKEFIKEIESREIRIVENVYPRVDFMNIQPLRSEIHKTFEEHIIHAKGMEHIKELVNQSIIPTPGSVLESTILLSEIYGNVMTIDVGGATTDIHSVCEPSDEYRKYYEGQPIEKRTVEGDLGVFVNHNSVLKLTDYQKLLRKLCISSNEFDELLNNYNYIPQTDLEKKLVYELTKTCVFHALNRHVGDLKSVYTSNGQKMIPEGKDLSQLQVIILTGGPLINLQDTEEILLNYFRENPTKLLPKSGIRIIKDEKYLLSSIGVLSKKYKDLSKQLLANYVK